MKLKFLTQHSLLISIGLALHIFEGFIPNPLVLIFPGARLGLANIIALIALVKLGFKSAITINVFRVIIAGLVQGTPISLLYSLSGAILSTTTMYIAYKYLSRVFSLVGVSVLGAIAHNTGQLIVASIIINNIGIFIYLPFMVLISLLTGIFIGLTGEYTIRKINI